MPEVKLTKANFDLRLQLIGCCIGSKTEEISALMNIGNACTGDIKKLEFFTIVRQILLDYIVDDSLTIVNQDLVNCIPYVDMLLMFERLSEYCDQCYPDITYISSVDTPCTTC